VRPHTAGESSRSPANGGIDAACQRELKVATLPKAGGRAAAGGREIRRWEADTGVDSLAVDRQEVSYLAPAT
jgi:hypothetical protein